MMKAFPKLAVAAVVGAALLTLGCSKQINFLKARHALNKGVNAFSAANYPLAAEQFGTALEYDPELNDARAYQAYAYMNQFVPGGETPENIAMADRALKGFEEVLAIDPDSILAISSMASLYFNMENFEEAEKWHRRRIEVGSAMDPPDPGVPESYYTIGVIKWTQSYEPRLALRADLGMRPEDPGPISDKEQRVALAEEIVPAIDDGLSALNEAVKINPDYADAMVYLNLLYRERADLVDTPEEYEEYMAQAEEWVLKTMDTRKRLAEESTIDQFTAE